MATEKLTAHEAADTLRRWVIEDGYTERWADTLAEGFLDEERGPAYDSDGEPCDWPEPDWTEKKFDPAAMRERYEASKVGPGASAWERHKVEA